MAKHPININRRLYFPTHRNVWIIGFILTLTYTLYIYFRRPHFQTQPITIEFLIYLINKGLAWTGLTLILISVAISPLARLIKPAKSLIKYRKDIGVIGFYFALFHLGFSLLLLPTRFPISSYLIKPLSLLTALLATSILWYITRHSRTVSISQLGLAKWKTVQRLVYLAIILDVFHYLSRGALPLWKNWLANPYHLPPLGLIITILVLTTLLLRLIVIPLGMPKSPKKSP